SCAPRSFVLSTCGYTLFTCHPSFRRPGGSVKMVPQPFQPDFSAPIPIHGQVQSRALAFHSIPKEKLLQRIWLYATKRLIGSRIQSRPMVLDKFRRTFEFAAI